MDPSEDSAIMATSYASTCALQRPRGGPKTREGPEGFGFPRVATSVILAYTLFFRKINTETCSL